MAAIEHGGRVKFMTRKQIKEQAARYTKLVEWSDEDQCFIGRCPELTLGGVHGSEIGWDYWS